jgi:hypothetical protein
MEHGQRRTGAPSSSSLKLGVLLSATGVVLWLPMHAVARLTFVQRRVDVLEAIAEYLRCRS